MANPSPVVILQRPGELHLGMHLHKKFVEAGLDGDAVVILDVRMKATDQQEDHGIIDLSNAGPAVTPQSRKPCRPQLWFWPRPT